MKKIVAFLLTIIVLTLCGCSQHIEQVDKEDKATVGDIDVQISEIRYTQRSGYRLMSVELTVTNNSNNRIDLPGEFSVFVQSDDKIYNVTSTGGIMTDIEPSQTVTSKFFFHIPDATYNSQDGLYLHIYQIDGYTHIDETAWKIK